MTAPTSPRSAPAAEPHPITVRAHRAAAMLGMSPRTLWGLTAPRGDIPCIRLGGRLALYRVRDLEQWASRRARESRGLPGPLSSGAPPRAVPRDSIGDAGSGS